MVYLLRDDDIEVLAEDGGKSGGETSPNRPLSRTPRWVQCLLHLQVKSGSIRQFQMEMETVFSPTVTDS